MVWRGGISRKVQKSESAKASDSCVPLHHESALDDGFGGFELVIHDDGGAEALEPLDIRGKAGPGEHGDIGPQLAHDREGLRGDWGIRKGESHHAGVLQACEFPGLMMRGIGKEHCLSMTFEGAHGFGI